MSRSYSSVLTWFGLTIAASLMLYHTSDRVNALGQQLNSLNEQIESEQQSLHVLKAEWVYLANPARVNAATRRHLALQPTALHRVVALKDIGSLLPLHGESDPVPSLAEATPDMPRNVASAKPDAVPAPVIVAKAQPALPLHAAPVKNTHMIGALNTGYINEHMIMPHTGTVEASNDKIGALINSLSLRP